MSDCGCGASESHKLQRKTLITVLLINGGMFLLEFAVGVFAQSSGLIADSLDMFADAFIYGLAFVAVGGSLHSQTKAAKISGYLQVLLGTGVLLDVFRRLQMGSEPVSTLIIIMGSLALIANSICLVLIIKHKDDGVHMRASVIFSANDVIANSGVIISGLLVWWLGSAIPDLVIGTIIAVVVIYGGYSILYDARKEGLSLK